MPIFITNIEPNDDPSSISLAAAPEGPQDSKALAVLCVPYDASLPSWTS
jgi:hypothetical protein